MSKNREKMTGNGGGGRGNGEMERYNGYNGQKEERERLIGN